MTGHSIGAHNASSTPAASTPAIRMSVMEPGGSLVPRPVEDVQPARGWVGVTVIASGVCYADVGTAAAPKATAAAPVTPGHEVAGVIAELGEDVEGWAVGDRVAVGWFGGSCGHCDFCRAGDVVHCPERQVPGLSYPGGWAETLTVPAGALARIPDGLDFFDAAPMGCAGVTTFNAVRHARSTRVRRSRCSGWAGSGTWPSSSPRPWGTGPSPSPAGRGVRTSPADSGRMSTSTAAIGRPARHWPTSAART